MQKGRIITFILSILFLVVSVTPSYARSGCCSHHGGVSGCGCADGTPLSATCLPYYPECSGGGGTQQDSTQVPQMQTYSTPAVVTDTATPILQATNTPIPTITPIPTMTPQPTKTPTPTVIIATPTPPSQTNFFSWLFGLFFGQKQQVAIKSHVQEKKLTPTGVTSSAGIESGSSTCKAVHTNPADPQAYLPDANCTPGTLNAAVTQATIDSTICVSGYTKTIRPSASYTEKLKKGQMQEYGYTDMNLSDYEEDHYISLELGGNPTDPKNLWPEPHASTNEKDKVENYLHKQVCDRSITLAQAQNEISKNWYQIYQQIK
jgi:hypothetical protein